MSTSLGIIGGLILSQFAVAIRIFRLVLLILTGLFDIYGFIIGLLITIVMIFTTKTIGKIKYTWALILFNGKAPTNVLFRKPIIDIKRNKRNK